MGYTMGGKQCLKDLRFVGTQMGVIQGAWEADDKIDADKDGMADVDQMSPKELLEHKMKVSMMAVKEPDKLETAVENLWAASLAVLATLKLKFAWTTALA